MFQAFDDATNIRAPFGAQVCFRRDGVFPVSLCRLSSTSGGAIVGAENPAHATCESNLAFPCGFFDATHPA